jgi:hypothetical protein
MATALSPSGTSVMAAWEGQRVEVGDSLLPYVRGEATVSCVEGSKLLS